MVASPKGVDASAIPCSLIGKLVLESSSKDSPGASLRSDPAAAEPTVANAMATLKARLSANETIEESGVGFHDFTHLILSCR